MMMKVIEHFKVKTRLTESCRGVRSLHWPGIPFSWDPALVYNSL